MKTMKVLLTLLGCLSINFLFADSSNGGGEIGTKSHDSKVVSVVSPNPGEDGEGVKDWLYSLFRTKEDTNSVSQDSLKIESTKKEYPTFDRVVY